MSPARSADAKAAGGAKGPTVKGVAYLKDAPEPPLLPLDQYPPWLPQLLNKPKATAASTTVQDGHIFFKKNNLEKIRKSNFLKDKKR